MLSRREFMGTVAAGAAGLAVSSSARSYAQIVGANERVNFAVIGTNSRGLVTLFRGVPLRLPAGIDLYQSDYVTGVSASTLTQARRKELLDHSLRSESNAIALIHSLELGQLE